MTLRIRVGAGKVRKYPVVADRPDVVEALRGIYGIEAARGFHLYLDLDELEPFTEPIPLRMEVVVDGAVARLDGFELSPFADLDLLETFSAVPQVMVDFAREHLHGRGLEFGALHSPLQVGPDCEMTYADHFLNEELYEVFPEIEEHVRDQMVDVELKVDLNTSDLTELVARDFDFFVANGVMEHLANPTQFLANVARVMRPGATLYVAVPDRNYAFDSRREITPFEHHWRDYECGVTEVEDDHIVDYLVGVGKEIPDDPEARAELIEEFRRHTVHAHVWDEESFAAFLRTADERVPLGLDLVAFAGPREAEGNIIAVLRKRAGA
ncbi:MAG: class I SAM-dependent methyltransferase [Acidimicrobiia bacterium]